MKSHPSESPGTFVCPILAESMLVITLEIDQRMIGACSNDNAIRQGSKDPDTSGKSQFDLVGLAYLKHLKLSLKGTYCRVR